MNLPENYKLAFAIVIGMITGFVLVKSDLCWRKNIKNFLSLQGGRVAKTVLITLAVSSTMFFFLHHFDIVALRITPGYFWSSLIGGALTGTGLALCALTPSGALVSLASGRIYALWVMLGMVLAMVTLSAVSGFLAKTIYSWGGSGIGAMEPTEFFSWNNPVIYIILISIPLATAIHFFLPEDAE